MMKPISIVYSSDSLQATFQSQTRIAVNYNYLAVNVIGTCGTDPLQRVATSSYACWNWQYTAYIRTQLSDYTNTPIHGH